MGLYEVLNVTTVEEAARLSRFEVERPVNGGEGDVYVVPVAGRVAGRDSEAEAVEVVYHDRVLRSVPIANDRDGWFHVLVGLIGLKLECELLLQAVLKDGTRVPFATISLRRQALRTEFEPTVQPLMLTSLERSGTTWLMKMFTSHPEIVVFRRFPYEYTPAKYWIHMLRVLSEPANLAESAHPDTFHGNPHWVGQNPFHDGTVFERPALEGWLGRGYVEQLATFCQSSIEEWYLRLAQIQEQDGAVYFAEKMWPSYLPVLTWELYPKAKEILLVRDFRDVACSMRAFDAGRSYSQFDRSHDGDGHPDLPGQLHAGAFAVRNSWRTRADRAHLVRYEDMVLRPAQTLAAMLEYLELDNSPQLVDRLLSKGAEDLPELPGATTDPYLVEIHRTIPDPKDTIGRWRQEGDDSSEDFYWSAIGEALKEFGYTKSGSFE
jgi:hypothetical protein